jgi:hypothetical protein
MDVECASGAAKWVLVSAARIAGRIAEGRVPPGRELFALSAAVVDAAHAGDLDALQVGVESSTALLESLPTDGTWQGCRGHLNATRQFAWLLLRMRHAGPAPDDVTAAQ